MHGKEEITYSGRAGMRVCSRFHNGNGKRISTQLGFGMGMVKEYHGTRMGKGCLDPKPPDSKYMETL